MHLIPDLISLRKLRRHSRQAISSIEMQVRMPRDILHVIQTPMKIDRPTFDAWLPSFSLTLLTLFSLLSLSLSLSLSLYLSLSLSLSLSLFLSSSLPSKISPRMIKLCFLASIWCVRTIMGRTQWRLCNKHGIFKIAIRAWKSCMGRFS